MTKWTSEQIKAITLEGQNIIVSAGAGSGKTAVLTERVITKLKKGININELLILTFTNAAANEMKDRIRKTLSKDAKLTNQLNYLDSAYITTFDSFAMSIVKKYHYLLNISHNVGIIDKTICDNLRKTIIEDIFENKYLTNNQYFLKLINDLTIKDDNEIKKNIIILNNDLDKLLDKEAYLNSYLDNYYTEENISRLVLAFNKLLNAKVKKIENLLYFISNYADEKYYHKIYEIIYNLISSKNYNQIKININIKIPNLPKDSSLELKNIKQKLVDEINSLKEILIYQDEEHLRKSIINTKDYAIAIIEIILELDKKLNEYKKDFDQYEFNDIAKMAIKVVRENPIVKEELTKEFKEIMIDEYQDTSDIQEALINLIGKNNLYMVGDIKQSIYRFRNANPTIFKNKYNEYTNNRGGIKIDLLNNFRSRKEVINDINNIFNLIMDETIGGANYKDGHQMNFGNITYEENKINNNYDLEIYNYEREDNQYSNAEYEAFIIANDIKNKINNNYLVLDKNTSKLRKCNYGDFCILIDRKSNFELYKKIFEYLKVPLVIYYDEKITNENDILVIKNIIDLIIRIYHKEFDERFKYDFYSISRSYLINNTDQQFLDYYLDKNYKESLLYKKCQLIVDKLDTLSNKSLIEEIIDTFNFYEQTILNGDIEKSIIRIEYLKVLADSLSNLGYSIIQFNDYLQNMVINNDDVTFSVNPKVAKNVKLLNIHKSKGLEFSICYYAGLQSKFNRLDLNGLFNFDSDLDLILPFYEDGVGNTIVKELYKDKYNLEDISERIRLFYVALTRAKEKMIIVANLNKEDKSLREEHLSFLEVINAIKETLNNKIININKIELTKEYNLPPLKEAYITNNSKPLPVTEISISNNVVETKQVSRTINKLIDNYEQDKLEYGTKMHRLFETSNFKSSNSNIVNKLLDKLDDLKEAHIYKEYEFIAIIDDKKYHGIIDLIIDYPNHLDIIDYKLKDISDKNYQEQLLIYKKYLATKTNKPINTYLYSMLDDELKQV